MWKVFVECEVKFKRNSNIFNIEGKEEIKSLEIKKSQLE